MEQVLGETSLSIWNDHPQRKYRDIIAALDRSITYLEEGAKMSPNYSEDCWQALDQYLRREGRPPMKMWRLQWADMVRELRTERDALVAQMEELQPCKLPVGGSNPPGGSTPTPEVTPEMRLAIRVLLDEERQVCHSALRQLDEWMRGRIKYAKDGDPEALLEGVQLVRNRFHEILDEEGVDIWE